MKRFRGMREWCASTELTERENFQQRLFLKQWGCRLLKFSIAFSVKKRFLLAFADALSLPRMVPGYDDGTLL